jgi:hypothetical protein
MSASQTQPSTTHHGVVGFIEDHWKLLLALVILVLIIATIMGLFKSPFWDALSNLFGVTATGLAAIENQLSICFSSFVNFINPGSGCFLGIGVMVTGLIWLVFKILSYRSSNALVEQAKFLTGKTADSLAKDLIKKYGDLLSDDKALAEAFEQERGRPPTDLELKALKRTTAIRALSETVTDAINKSPMSPDEKNAQTKAQTANTAAARNAVQEETHLTSDDMDAVDKVAEEMVPER